ncbi:MAG: GYD domain-containing protein [Planctomycetaceae bacterium]|nr:GYD domain-containing protein [Planctomycetaceae bacterium]
MATFISLITWTQPGEEAVKRTIDRADAFREVAKQSGATVKDVYWTLGGYDGVLVFEARDDAAATALMLKLGSQGNVRTKTMRAFSASEMQDIISRV